MAESDSIHVKQEHDGINFCALTRKHGDNEEWITGDCSEVTEDVSKSVRIKQEHSKNSSSVLRGDYRSNEQLNTRFCTEEMMAARSDSMSIKEEPQDTTLHLLPESRDSNNGSDGKMTSDSLSQALVSKRKVRKCFRVDEDVCLLQEVVSSRPFEHPEKWDVVLKNVERSVMRRLTMRGIKDRVDLLIGYFWHQDRVSLRKSGTEEQYAERKQLLQEVSNLAREFNYVPRTWPRKGNGMALTKRPLPMVSPSAQLHLAEKTGDTTMPLLAESPFNQTLGQASEPQSSASHLLRGMCEPELQSPAMPAEQEFSIEEDMEENTQEDDFCSRNPEQPPVRRRCGQANPRGLRRLQTVGLELLTRREMHEYETRKRELELEKRRLEYDENRLALEERKLELEERKHLFEVSCRAEDRKQLLDHMEKLFQEQQRKISDLLEGKDTS